MAIPAHLQVHADRIRAAGKRTLAAAWELGQRLLDARRAARHGEWGRYSVTGCGTDFLQWKWAEMNRAVGEVAA